MSKGIENLILDVAVNKGMYNGPWCKRECWKCD
jgi:hypothetical protein